MLGEKNEPPYLRPYGPQEPSPRTLASLVGGTDPRHRNPHNPLFVGGTDLRRRNPRTNPERA